MSTYKTSLRSVFGSERGNLFHCVCLLALGLVTLPVFATPVVETLGPSSPLRGANGLAFDGQDRLLVASVIGRSITMLNRETGAVLDVIDDSQGVETPDDVAVAPDGSIYWSALLVGRVGRLSPDGTVVQQEVDHSLNSIAVSSTGRVFASQCGFLGGSNIYELDPALQNPPRLITSAVGVECGVNGMAVDSEDHIYGPRFFNDDIVRINPDTGAFDVVANGFDAPSAVRLGTDGMLYVTDFIVGDVFRVNPADGTKTLLADLSSGLDSLAVDSQNRVFVSNNVTSEILEVLPDGGTRVVLASGLAAPGGLALRPRDDGGESLYVADFTSIVELDKAAGTVRSVADSTFRADLDDPATLFYDGEKFVLSAWSANTVQVWDADSGAVEMTVHDFNLPLNAIRFMGDLVVSELGTGSVVRGADIGGRQTLMSGLVIPTGLAAKDGNLYVADQFQGSVWQIAENGQIMDPPRIVALSLAGPEGLTFDNDGKLLVVEAAGGRVSRIDTETREIETVVNGLNLGVQASSEVSVPSVFFSDIVVDENGVIYVSGDVDSTIYRIIEDGVLEGDCTPGPSTLCFQNGRFRMQLEWRQGAQSGLANVHDRNDQSAILYFFDAENWEAVVKVLDGCNFNGNYWVFSAIASDLELTLTVTDTATGAERVYTNPAGNAADTINDTGAFACQ